MRWWRTNNDTGIGKTFLQVPRTYVMSHTVDDSVQTKLKKPSKEFLAMVDEWADSYVKTSELPSKIIELGKKEQLPDDIVRREIESALRVRHVSERRIRQLIPQELKKLQMVREKPAKIAATSAANPPQERETITLRHPIVESEDEEGEGLESENEFLREEVAQLKDAIKKLQTFPKAAELVSSEPQPTMTKEDPDINTVQFKLSLSSGKDYLKQRMTDFSQQVLRELPQLQRRGWRWVRVTIEVSS